MAAHRDDAPGDGDPLARVGSRPEVGEALADRGGGVVAVEADRIGVDAALAHRVELGEPVGAFLLEEAGARAVAGVVSLRVLLGAQLVASRRFYGAAL